MSEWREVKLGEVLTLSQGLAINKQSKHLQTEDNNEIPLLRIADLIEKTKTRYIKREVPDRFIAHPDELIYTRTGRVGLVFKNRYGVVHNNCFKIKPNEEIVDKDFLYWLLSTKFIYSHVNSIATGAAQPDLTHSKFKSIKVLIPDLEKQKKISYILSTYDKLIENNNRRIQILEQTAEELYKEWFVRMRFPGYEKTKFDKGIPEGWEVTKFINENCELIPSGVKRYDNLKQYIATADVNELEISNGEYFDYKNRPSRANMEPKVNSLWFAKMADSRKHMYIIEENFYIYCNYIFSTGFAGISCKKEYFYYYLSFIRYGGFEELKDSYANGATQVAINNDNIKRIPILIPELKLIERFNAIVKDIYIEISKLQKSSKILMKNRDLLLPRLMNGTITVK